MICIFLFIFYYFFIYFNLFFKSHFNLLKENIKYLCITPSCDSLDLSSVLKRLNPSNINSFFFSYEKEIKKLFHEIYFIHPNCKKFYNSFETKPNTFQIRYFF
jgi:hypothetical protein